NVTGVQTCALPIYTPSSNIVTELFVKGTEPKETSKKFDQLDPVSNLSAEYDEDNDKIIAEWDYDSDEEDISFEVSMRSGEGDINVLSTTEDQSMEITQVEPGTEYEIQVIAIKDDNRSEPTSTKVTIQDDEGENINPVEGLNAEYKTDSSIIDVSWGYNGPPASFEV